MAGLFAFLDPRYIGSMGWTVQELINKRMRLSAHCNRCNHSQALDLEALKAKLGPNAPAMADDLTPRLKCGKCDGKDVGLIYAPDTSPTGSYTSVWKRNS